MDQNWATLEEFRELLESREWDDGKPMSEQMTADEASRFGQLQHKQQAALVATLHESKRLRDIQIITRMAKLADLSARWSYEGPDEKDTESMYLIGFLLALRDLVPVANEEVDGLSEPTGPCTLETSLIAAAVRTAKEVHTLDPSITEVSEMLQHLRAKYGDPLTIERMSPRDAEWFANARTSVKQGMVIADLAKDFVRLATLEKTSKLMLESWRQDQYEASGNLDYVGTNWDVWVKSGRVSKAQNDATKVLNAINEQFPSDVVENAKEANETEN